MYRSTVLLTVTLVALAAADVAPYRPPATVPDAGIGLHYDGSAVVPDAKPPLGFDQKSGKNIRWRVELPQWGMAGLVPVGNRVLHLADTDVRFIWPVLRCYDAKTGTLAWERELDPLDAFAKLSAAERERVTGIVTRLWDDNRFAFRAMRPVIAATGRAGKDHPLLKAANARLAERGITVESFNISYGALRKTKWPEEYDQLKKDLHGTYNIQPNLSNQGIERTGDAFGTPVSDGEHVYVTTIHGHVTAVRMADGSVAWTRSLAEMEAPAYKEANHFMTSSRLYKDVLLAFWGDTNSSVPDVLVAMDKRSGKELWHLAIRHWDSSLGGQWQADDKKAFWGRPGASPRIMEIDGEAIALLGVGMFVRVRDGKPYEGGVLSNVQNYVIDPVGKRVFGCVSLDGAGSHFGARLSMKDGTLAFESLFFWPRAGVGGGWGGHGLWHEGRLLLKGFELDPATGVPLAFEQKPTDAKDFKKKVRPLVKRGDGGDFGFGRMFTVLANDHIYGLAIDRKPGKDKNPHQYGVLYVTSLDGKRVSRSELVQDEATPEHLLDQGWPAKDQWSYTGPMAIGEDCVYIASDQYLYCIGK